MRDCCFLALPTASPDTGPSRQPVTARRAITLTPVSANGFDALDTSGDPRNENGNLAAYAIDQDPATSWQSQYYLGNPVFGGLKAGSGLIVDMGRKVRLTSVTVTFGATPGADVSIMAGNHDTLAAASLSASPPSPPPTASAAGTPSRPPGPSGPATC